MELLTTKWGVESRIIDDPPTPDSELQIKASLRNIPPQIRGEIVTSRGDDLPLSQKGKNLNLDKTPILLVEKDGVLVDIFPKRIEDLHIDVRKSLLQMLEHGIQLGRPSISPEGLARSRMVTNLIAIEPGLELVGEEVAVSAGFIDVLLKDASGRFLVVELKRAANDDTIGQVLRLSASLAQRESIEPASVRKMIVCARVNTHVELAAASVRIEIRKHPELFKRGEDPAPTMP